MDHSRRYGAKPLTQTKDSGGQLKDARKKYGDPEGRHPVPANNLAADHSQPGGWPTDLKR